MRTPHPRSSIFHPGRSCKRTTLAAGPTAIFLLALVSCTGEVGPAPSSDMAEPPFDPGVGSCIPKPAPCPHAGGHLTHDMCADLVGQNDYGAGSVDENGNIRARGCDATVGPHAFDALHMYARPTSDGKLGLLTEVKTYNFENPNLPPFIKDKDYEAFVNRAVEDQQVADRCAFEYQFIVTDYTLYKRMIFDPRIVAAGVYVDRTQQCWNDPP